MCLKNQVQKNGFSIDKINLNQLGHGCYLIGTGGVCWSHSSEHYNNVGRSPWYWRGDWIYMEYDPIKW